MTVKGDEALTGQVPHRLPDRGGAHFQLGCDVGLDQLRAAGEITTEDGRAQGVPDQIDGGDPT